MGRKWKEIIHHRMKYMNVLNGNYNNVTFACIITCNLLKKSKKKLLFFGFENQTTMVVLVTLKTIRTGSQ